MRAEAPVQGATLIGLHLDSSIFLAELYRLIYCHVVHMNKGMVTVGRQADPESCELSAGSRLGKYQKLPRYRHQLDALHWGIDDVGTATLMITRYEACHPS
jgi:hypothetical protein